MGGARGLKRVAKLFAMVEDLNAMQVKAAAAAVFEVERAAEELAAARMRGAAEGRAGLARGSRVEALSSDQSASKDVARAELLGRLEAERRSTLTTLVEIHRVSRIEARQVEGLIERLEINEATQRDRQTQAESDDRYLSRRAWMRSKQP